MLTAPNARRGRPRAAERGTSISVWIPATIHARLIAHARDQRVSVSKLVRQYVLTQSTPKKS